MENASKALIFAASTLVAIMLLSLLAYTFRRFGTAARETEERWAIQEIEEYNAKFSGYETGGNHSLDDKISVTTVRKTNSSGATVEGGTVSYKYSQLFASSRQIVGSDYEKALVSASQKLNNCYNVVSALNDAISINASINNDYQYGQLEIQDSVEIIVDLGSYKNDFSFNKKGGNSFRYLLVEPNKNVKSKCAYGSNSIATAGTNETKKQLNSELSIFNSSNEIKIYNMLDELRATKEITINGKTYTVYKYYFFGQTIISSVTGKIETVKFTLLKDKNF